MKRKRESWDRDHFYTNERKQLSCFFQPGMAQTTSWYFRHRICGMENWSDGTETNGQWLEEIEEEWGVLIGFSFLNVDCHEVPNFFRCGVLPWSGSILSFFIFCLHDMKKRTQKKFNPKVSCLKLIPIAFFDITTSTTWAYSRLVLSSPTSREGEEAGAIRSL